MSSGATGSISTSRPSWALGLCDRCGFSFKLNQLYREVYDERENGLLVCRTCLDVDNPQLQLGRQSFPDPQSLYNPRPDTGVPGSTSYFGWRPIGSPLTTIPCQVGNLTVLII